MFVGSLALIHFKKIFLDAKKIKIKMKEFIKNGGKPDAKNLQSLVGFKVG